MFAFSETIGVKINQSYEFGGSYRNTNDENITNKLWQHDIEVTFDFSDADGASCGLLNCEPKGFIPPTGEIEVTTFTIFSGDEEVDRIQLEPRYFDEILPVFDNTSGADDSLCLSKVRTNYTVELDGKLLKVHK